MKLPRTAFRSLTLLLVLLLGSAAPAALPPLHAQDAAVQAGVPEHRPGGEVNLRLPDLNQGDFFGFTGHQILLSGILVLHPGAALRADDLLGGASKLPVHRSMAEVSDLIYETCKAVPGAAGQVPLILLAFIGSVIVVYFLLTGLELPRSPSSSCSACRLVAWRRPRPGRQRER